MGTVGANVHGELICFLPEFLTRASRDPVMAKHTTHVLENTRTRVVYWGVKNSVFFGSMHVALKRGACIIAPVLFYYIARARCTPGNLNVISRRVCLACS